MDPRITARFGDAARLLGDIGGIGAVTLVEHGPFAWLETDAVLTFDVRALFFEDDAWRAMPRDLDTFRHVVAHVRPPLHDWQPIVRAHQALTFDAPLLTRAQVDDLTDARWYVMPLDAARAATWHAPRFDGAELVWFVERFPHNASMARVRIDASYRVEVE
jgi:hypothetical protein